MPANQPLHAPRFRNDDLSRAQPLVKGQEFAGGITFRRDHGKHSEIPVTNGIKHLVFRVWDHLSRTRIALIEHNKSRDNQQNHHSQKQLGAHRASFRGRKRGVHPSTRRARPILITKLCPGYRRNSNRARRPLRLRCRNVEGTSACAVNFRDASSRFLDCGARDVRGNLQPASANRPRHVKLKNNTGAASVLSFLDELNPQQREAVETTEGPVLILAGAGSGKTRVITFRIAYLIEHLGVMPESILAMTFTNKAASEMAERVEKLVGRLSIAKPVISTFHSFCVRVLRRDIEALRIPSAVPGQPPIGLTKNFVIYDESDQQQVVKGIMRRLGLDDKQLTPRNVLSRISWAKNHMLDPQEIYLQSADPKTEKIAHIYEEYRKELRKANAMDFDDLLLEAMRLLKAVSAVREYYNRRFQYLLIDEYQDTNRPQYELMRMLAGDRHNVCAVGDEDQSIYSWRGADIRNILEFEQDFPEAKIIRLEQNYRSTQNILQAASAVVPNNIHPAECFASSDNSAPGE